MSNPAMVDCPADVWTEVATGVTSGVIHKRSLAPNIYKQTFRLTGEAAPSNDDDAALIFDGALESIISSDSAIDVYIKAVGVDGEVRVDI